MALLNLRTNHLPIMVRLTTESALWPKPRIRISNTSSNAAEATLLNARTIQLSANKTTETTVRTPKRSIAGPQSKLKEALSRVAQKFIWPKLTR